MLAFKFRRRNALTLIATAGLALWLAILFMQHASVIRLEQQHMPQHLYPSPVMAISQYNNRSKQQQGPASDLEKASFNGIPVIYASGVPQSDFDCTQVPIMTANGTFSRKNDWMFRSCRFHNLCFDTQEKEYVLFLSPDNDKFHHNLSLALGGVNPRWDMRKGFDKGSWKMRWFPRVVRTTFARTSSESKGYYQLPPDQVLIPFHSLGAHNVGHLLWDDFYPIFSLLRWFGLLPGQERSQFNSFSLLLIRHVIAQPLYATCEIRKNKRQQCAANFAKFLPLIGVDPGHFSVSKEAQFNNQSLSQSKSNLVCASTAVAGLGMLTDHGFRDHGWNDLPDTHSYVPHNLGRGSNFGAFSRFLVDNLLGHDTARTTLPRAPPVRITISQFSSRDKNRWLGFSSQIQYLQQHLSPQFYHLNPVKLSDLDLRQQVELAQSSHIFITACGGGNIQATFLPPGATLIVFFHPSNGMDFSSPSLDDSYTGYPARLDWDLLNNAGHLRVHWWPITNDMNEAHELELLHQVILHESQFILDHVQRQRVAPASRA